MVTAFGKGTVHPSKHFRLLRRGDRLESSSEPSDRSEEKPFFYAVLIGVHSQM